MNQEIVFDSKLQSMKNLAFWLYLAHGVSLLFAWGALSWIPLIVSYLKRGDAAGTFVYSHHTWQIRTFWWYLGWWILAGALWWTFILIPLSFLIWGVSWLWAAYRVIRGLIDLNDNKPMPA